MIMNEFSTHIIKTKKCVKSGKARRKDIFHFHCYTFYPLSFISIKMDRKGYEQRPFFLKRHNFDLLKPHSFHGGGQFYIGLIGCVCVFLFCVQVACTQSQLETISYYPRLGNNQIKYIAFYVILCFLFNFSISILCHRS